MSLLSEDPIHLHPLRAGLAPWIQDAVLAESGKVLTFPLGSLLRGHIKPKKDGNLLTYLLTILKQASCSPSSLSLTARSSRFPRCTWAKCAVSDKTVHELSSS